MTLLRTCPRCGSVAREPGDQAPVWTCEQHGDVVPVGPAQAPTQKLLRQVALDSLVPVWIPHPMPDDWQVTGLQWAGSGGSVAVVVAVSGPHPMPEVGDEEPTVDLIFVAEQPGIGLGAHLAGLDGVDPGPLLAEKAAHDPAEIKLHADDHEVPLWSIPLVDGLAYVGEASGVWLWVLAWPSSAALALLNRFSLVDARNEDAEPDLPCGALTPRLR
ncbi:DUF6758 family protein [Kineosporia mesophila]|uniref:DUF6758 family protein n=1 Tax=Kineosporia mesophila TaxID=566012 RepID=UPI001E4A0806|nr:DUF6758 family protein [Kineosporia mesophila]MCD5351699.1 hypothetical protein [Kineosporia mesophila]